MDCISIGENERDFFIEIKTENKIRTLHIPKKELFKVQSLINALLNTKGVNSYVTEEDGKEL